MGSQNVQPVKIEPTQIMFKKDGEVYSVGTVDMRIRKSPVIERSTSAPPGTSRSLALQPLHSNGVEVKRPGEKKPARIKRTLKRIGLFLLILSGLFPPWGMVLLVGWLVYRSRPKNKSKRLFKKALKLAPNNPNGALPLLEEAHKLNPADNDVLGAAGYVSHNAEDYTMAWRFLSELGRHVPLTPPELLILGNSLYKTEQYDKAIEALQKVPEDYDQYTKVVLLLGGCFTAKGDHEAAAEMLKKGSRHMLSMNDDLKELHYQLGLVYEMKGEEEAAKREFKQVYLADVNYRDVKERIGRGQARLQPAAEHDDVTQQIRKLAVLKDEGLLTEDEYEAKKADLLARI